MNLKYLLLLAILTFGMAACGDDEEEDPMTPDPMGCDTSDVTFTNGVQAILDTNCTISGCHNDVDLANGFSMETFDQAVVAGNFPSFFPSINFESGVSPMPRGADQLAQCDIDILTAWSDAGFPE